MPAAALPPALANEGFFAASGTNVTVAAPNHIWLGTGAASEARVLRSSDGGRTWAVAKAPLDAGPSAGIFSIAFSDAQHGIIVGGDYKAETVAGNNAAITTDGGATWTAVKGLSGFRSVVAYAPGNASTIVAVGPAGTDVSNDRGRTWSPIAGPGFHAFSFRAAKQRRVWRRGERQRRETGSRLDRRRHENVSKSFSPRRTPRTPSPSLITLRTRRARR